MVRKTTILEIDAESEDLLRCFAAFLEEMSDVALADSDDSVLEACE